MNTVIETLLEAAYGEDAVAVQPADPTLGRGDLVFLVGPRAERPAADSALIVRKALYRMVGHR